jgi:hypothetical protein
MEREKDVPIHITPIQEEKYANFHTLSSYMQAVESYYDAYVLYPATEIL